MKIYLAAMYEKRAVLRHLAEILKENGHSITSPWIYSEHDPSKQDIDWAFKDLEDIRESDAFILLHNLGDSNFRGGAHFETGVAFAWGIPIYVLGPGPENLFHILPAIRVRQTIEEIIRDLQ